MFQQIESNKRLSVLLMVMVTALLVVVGWAIGGAWDLPWYVGVSVALAVAIVVGCISYYSGGRIVLALSGAREIRKRDHPRLFNVVEEMAIAAGMPMPRVYIIEDSAPNAFATGRKPEEAAIAVTRGLLEKLNRDELQGVVAHEMSHIRNYDVLFMTMMAVMVGSVALLCDAFLRATYWGGGRYRSRSRRTSGSNVMVLIALVLAILAPLIGKLIQLAASRRREYLADASAALLTRYPPGLASALRKISADPEPLEAANRATQHMYIVNPLKGMGARAQSLWSTHPPIEERIKRLDRMSYMAVREEAAVAEASRPVSVAGRGVLPAAPSPAAGTLETAARRGEAGPGAALVSAADRPAVGHPACPRCSETLRPARLRGRPMKVCRACGGVWIGRADAAELLLEAPDRLVAADARFPNLIGVGWSRIGAKRCPQCGEGLREAAVKGVGGVLVDECARCEGVWFDDGELAAVATAAREARAETPSG